MPRPETDDERDERIEMEIIVDTDSPEEQAMGWYDYLDDTMEFPFEARCLTARAESPLTEGETVRVGGMSPTAPTLSQMVVTIEWMTGNSACHSSNWNLSKPAGTRNKQSRTGATGSNADNRGSVIDGTTR
jgi:hypothetical protein